MSSISIVTRLHIKWQRLVRWEFWSWRVVYIPIAVYWFFLAIRAKGWVFFSAANPCMRFGGLVAYSKSKVNQLVPKEYLPSTVYTNSDLRIEEVLELIAKNDLQVPLIVKPDIGERGWGVKIVSTQHELEAALADHHGRKLIQEYADLPMELGVMYSRYPEEDFGRIDSIVIKEFPTVVGDGTKTLSQLILENHRARLSYLVHEKKFGNQLFEVPEKGEEIEVVQIGNHMLGTTFYNGNHLIDDELTIVFDKLAKRIDDFYIGRFDLRTSSIDDLKKGDFVVIEVNGVNSEPCHIFHPGRSIFLAWRDLFRHWKRIADISIANHNRGVPYSSYAEIRREIKKHNAEISA